MIASNRSSFRDSDTQATKYYLAIRLVTLALTGSAPPRRFFIALYKSMFKETQIFKKSRTYTFDEKYLRFQVLTYNQKQSTLMPQFLLTLYQMQIEDGEEYQAESGQTTIKISDVITAFNSTKNTNKFSRLGKLGEFSIEYEIYIQTSMKFLDDLVERESDKRQNLELSKAKKSQTNDFGVTHEQTLEYTKRHTIQVDLKDETLRDEAETIKSELIIKSDLGDSETKIVITPVVQDLNENLVSEPNQIEEIDVSDVNEEPQKKDSNICFPTSQQKKVSNSQVDKRNQIEASQQEKLIERSSTDNKLKQFGQIKTKETFKTRLSNKKHKFVLLLIILFIVLSLTTFLHLRFKVSLENEIQMKEQAPLNQTINRQPIDSRTKKNRKSNNKTAKSVKHQSTYKKTSK